MPQLFRHLFNKVKRTLPSQLPLSEAITAYAQQHDPRNPLILHRLPRQELFNIASLPCMDPESQVIVESSK